MTAPSVDLSALDALASDMEALRRFLALHGSERACAAFARIASALEAARADGGWLPIESAPSDTEVLMYCPHRHASNPERVEAGVYHDTRGGWCHSFATHWRPLPSPPASASKDDPNV